MPKSINWFGSIVLAYQQPSLLSEKLSSFPVRFSGIILLETNGCFGIFFALCRRLYTPSSFCLDTHRFASFVGFFRQLLIIQAFIPFVAC
jgi:hypothetical protein